MHISKELETQGAPNRRVAHTQIPAIPLTWLLLSLTVTGLVALVILFLVMGRGLSERVNDLEGDNASLGVNRLVEDSQVVDSILQLRVISFWLAYPTGGVILEPPSGTGNSQGVLRAADDGFSAILMVAGLQELSGSTSYDVWLISGGQRVHASQLRVDSLGWGATTIYLDKPIFEFDTMEITTVGGSGSASGVKVLGGKIGLEAKPRLN